MPKQNRVTPFGQRMATPARGTLLGNRGTLHNDQGIIVRSYQGQRWIICQLSFKDRQRIVMSPGRYTELFFLDEATALAAGHRPCCECRREAYHAFREAWVAAGWAPEEAKMPKATEIDRVLHRERIGPTGEKVTFMAPLGLLPAGVFVSIADQAYLVWQEQLFPWMAAGYGTPVSQDTTQVVQVLTPRSTVAVLHQGYVPEVYFPAIG